jgi:hypothetical protein
VRKLGVKQSQWRGYDNAPVNMRRNTDIAMGFFDGGAA